MSIEQKPIDELLKLATIGEATVEAVRASGLLKPKPRRRARSAMDRQVSKAWERSAGETPVPATRRRAPRQLPLDDDQHEDVA